MTELLYQTDGYLQTFDASVVAVDLEQHAAARPAAQAAQAPAAAQAAGCSCSPSPGACIRPRPRRIRPTPKYRSNSFNCRLSWFCRFGSSPAAAMIPPDATISAKDRNRSKESPAWTSSTSHGR